MAYTKLFSDIVASSIWDEDDKTRIVWITMLALKNRDHYVRGTEAYLAGAARVTLDECRKALEKLSSPDPNSHNKQEEGRRIRDAPGGWVIVSGDYYQKKLSLEERREYNRQKQREYRQRRKSIRIAGVQAGAQRAIKEGLEG